MAIASGVTAEALVATGHAVRRAVQARRPMVASVAAIANMATAEAFVAHGRAHLQTVADAVATANTAIAEASAVTGPKIHHPVTKRRPETPEDQRFRFPRCRQPCRHNRFQLCRRRH